LRVFGFDCDIVDDEQWLVGHCVLKVLWTNGILTIVYFIITVFFGSFYLLNIMLAVVNITYQEEASRATKVSCNGISPVLTPCPQHRPNSNCNQH
jgi:hypothetical protein